MLDKTSGEFDEFKRLISSNSIKAISEGGSETFLFSHKTILCQKKKVSKEKKKGESKKSVENFRIFKEENLFISQMFWRVRKITFAFARRKFLSAKTNFAVECKAEEISTQATFSKIIMFYDSCTITSFEMQ